MRSFVTLPLRIRLTIWYLGVLAGVLLLYIGGTAFVLYFQLSHQLTRFAIQDVETVEGLLLFQASGRLTLNEDYHNHPQSRQVLERLVEVLSPAGAVLYRNERLKSNTLGGEPFQGEGVNGYSVRSAKLANGESILLVSRRHSILGRPVIIRLGYEKATIWSQIREFLMASITALPVLLALAGLLGYQLARRSLSPLGNMAYRAEQITAERLDQRLPVDNPEDELGHLARVFNSVLNRLQQSFIQLRQFTSDASHELRTPLAAIRSVGEVGLQKSRTAAEYKDTIGSMLEEVNRLTKLVENLLTLSRADSGQIELNFSVFPLLDLVKQVIGIFEVLADERKQTLIVSGDSLLKVRADALLLRQALINVLHNAMKYSPAGGEISVVVASGASGFAAVRVSDSGPGIPLEHRSRIFDRFYRVDAGRTRDMGGAGLGLSIASWAITTQDGTLRVDDEGEGATFTIELPLSRN